MPCSIPCDVRRRYGHLGLEASDESDDGTTEDEESLTKPDASSVPLNLGGEELKEALKEAVKRGDVTGVQTALKSRADVNAKYGPGITPLHLAALHNKPEVVRVLMDAGAKTGTKTTDEAKMTPWMLARATGNHEALEALVDEPEHSDPGRRRFLGPCCIASCVFALLSTFLLLVDGRTRWVGWREPQETFDGCWHREAVTALSICCLSCLALVNMLDPGAVCQDEVEYVQQLQLLHPEKTVVKDQYNLDFIKEDGSHDSFRWCISCKLWRPESVSHCSECRRCLWRFDHHCAAIGNCVGAGNHRVFAPMLLSGALAWALALHGVLVHLWRHGAFDSFGPWERLLGDVAQWPLGLAAVFIAFGTTGCATLLMFSCFHTGSLLFDFTTKSCYTVDKWKLRRPNLQGGSQLFSLWLGPVRWRSCDRMGSLKPLTTESPSFERRELREIGGDIRDMPGTPVGVESSRFSTVSSASEVGSARRGDGVAPTSRTTLLPRVSSP